MNFLELAKARRSVRQFSDKEVSNDQITQLLEAAQAAPSAGNCQAWHFYVIKGKELKQTIAEISYMQTFIATAPVVFIVCADIARTTPRYGTRGKNLYCLQDTAAAIENLLLCVQELGLGACWCGAFDEKKISEILSLNNEMRPIAVIPVGYPLKSQQNATRRRPVEEIATFVD